MRTTQDETQGFETGLQADQEEVERSQEVYGSGQVDERTQEEVMQVKVRGRGYGLYEIEYEKYDSTKKQWFPITKSKLDKLLHDGCVVLMNPGR